jgi:phosphatidylcholine synthase
VPRSHPDPTATRHDPGYPDGSRSFGAAAERVIAQIRSPRSPMSASTARGYLVHLYTTSTLFFVVLAVQWILDGRYQLALVGMAITVVIDATDGALARKHRVAQTVPGIDGSLLDNVVDFVSYVFLPILFLIHAGLLLEPVTAFATLLAFSSAYGFSRTTAKQSDEGFFVGFPSYWNVVVFYAYLLDLSPALTTALVVGLSMLVFTGVRFLYVTRLPRGRTLHLVLGSVWGATALAALLIDAGPIRTALTYASLTYVVFYTAHSVFLDVQSRRSRTSRALLPADLND